MKKYWKYSLEYVIIKKAVILIFLFLFGSCSKDDKESFLERYNGISWENENSNDGFSPIGSNEILMFSSGTSFYNTAITDQALWDEQSDGFWPCKSFEEGDNRWIGFTSHNFKILKNNFNKLIYEYRIGDELMGQYEFTAEGKNLRCTLSSSDGSAYFFYGSRELTVILIRSNESFSDWCSDSPKPL